METMLIILGYTATAALFLAIVLPLSLLAAGCLALVVGAIKSEKESDEVTLKEKRAEMGDITYGTPFSSYTINVPRSPEPPTGPQGPCGPSQ